MQLFSPVDGEQPRFAAIKKGLWPDGVVAYTVASNLSNPKRVSDAIAHWEAKTQLRFVERTDETAYVTFRPGSGCSSSFGRLGKQQFINLASSCDTGTTIHEIGHAIGLYHTQARSDRDQNVQVHWDNIQSGLASQFQTWVEAKRSGQDLGAYEIGSIMHYGSYAFAKGNKPTITKLNGDTFSTNRKGLSAGDIAGVAALYSNIFGTDGGVAVPNDGGPLPPDAGPPFGAGLGLDAGVSGPSGTVTVAPAPTDLNDEELDELVAGYGCGAAPWPQSGWLLIICGAALCRRHRPGAK